MVIVDSANHVAFPYGSSLLIMEGGKAHMVGTPDSTIVMTGFGDDFRDIACFGPGVKGMWADLSSKVSLPVVKCISRRSAGPLQQCNIL